MSGDNLPPVIIGGEKAEQVIIFLRVAVDPEGGISRLKTEVINIIADGYNEIVRDVLAKRIVKCKKEQSGKI